MPDKTDPWPENGWSEEDALSEEVDEWSDSRCIFRGVGVERETGEGRCDLLGVEQEEGGGIKALLFPAVKFSMISRDIDDRDTDGREYLHVESFLRDCSFVRSTNLKEGALLTVDLYGRINLEGSDDLDKKKAGVITWLSYTGRSKTMFLAWLDVGTGYQ